MMPAISYSVETGFVIFVNSPLFLSCSIKSLKPTLIRLQLNLPVCFLKNNRKQSFLFLWGWGALEVSRPIFCCWGRLVFCFWLFFCLCWDGGEWDFICRLCWVGGMGWVSMLVSI